MGLVVGFFIFMFIAFVVATSGNRNSGAAALGGGGGSFFATGPFGLGNATAARGIMLSVSNTGSGQRFNGQRYEVRGARVDVEVPGYAPFETSANVYIPGNLVRDVLPGSTMEIRIDLGNRGRVLVVGPDVGYSQGAVKTT